MLQISRAQLRALLMLLTLRWSEGAIMRICFRTELPSAYLIVNAHGTKGVLWVLDSPGYQLVVTVFSNLFSQNQT